MIYIIVCKHQERCRRGTKFTRIWFACLQTRDAQMDVQDVVGRSAMSFHLSFLHPRNESKKRIPGALRIPC